MTELAAAATAAIVAAGWNVTDLESESAGERHYRLDGERSASTRQLVIVVHERSAVLACYSVAAERVPPGARGPVIELLTMANYGLVEGNFELDLSDGEVRFKTSAYVVAPLHLDDVIDRLIGFNTAVFDLYGAAIDEVASGRLGPTAALAAAESG